MRKDDAWFCHTFYSPPPYPLPDPTLVGFWRLTEGLAIKSLVRSRGRVGWTQKLVDMYFRACTGKQSLGQAHGIQVTCKIQAAGETCESDTCDCSMMLPSTTLMLRNRITELQKNKAPNLLMAVCVHIHILMGVCTYACVWKPGNIRCLPRSLHHSDKLFHRTWN